MKPDLDRHFIFFSEPYYNFPIQWFSKSNIAMVYTPREQKGSNFNAFFPIEAATMGLITINIARDIVRPPSVAKFNLSWLVFPQRLFSLI
jgi:hypothetical protein